MALIHHCFTAVKKTNCEAGISADETKLSPQFFSKIRAYPSSHKTTLPLLLLAVIALQACKSEKKTYQSSCNTGISFKRVSFSHLIDSIKNYDQQYVEVDGTYKEGAEQSALVNDSLFTDHSTQHALWVNFSQDCPLVLKGTHKGLFEYNDGKFTQIDNMTIIIRGKIDVRHKGHLGSYSATIDRVSFIEL